MKKSLLLMALIFTGILAGKAQTTNLVFFTENGERFTLIMNGIQQNPQPETNVRVTGLIAPNYKIKIIFEDKKLGEVSKNLMFGQGTETTFAIKKNNKGEYVVRYLNEVPLAQAPPSQQNQREIVYTTTPPPATTTISTQHTTTTTTSGSDLEPGTVNMGMNIQDPATGVSVNMNIGVPGSVTTSSSQTTTTTTTTTYSGGTEIQSEHQGEPHGGHHGHHNQGEVYVMPGYNGPVGCPWPMTPQEFSSVKQSISSKSFDDTRLTIAKQVISNNCLTSNQVKEIMLLFNFEDTRLELAKWAYGYTFDIGNYYKLNDAFTFESSIEELNEYINGYR